MTRATLIATLVCAVGSVAAAQPSAPADSLRAVLLEIREADQAPRLELMVLMAEHDNAPPDSLVLPIALRMRQSDAEQLARLVPLLDRHGWPARSEVGDEAAKAAFLVVQHAPVDAQEQYLPLLEAAVAEGEADAADLALLTDRIAMFRGRPQRYGSQVTSVDGARAFHPIEDVAAVDARRAEVGLEPLAAYAERVEAPLPEGYTPGDH